MLLLVVATGGIVACAAGSGSASALKWVEEDEAQKRRLEDAGFPQYVGE